MVAAALGFTTTTTTLLALTALVGLALAVSQPAEFALVPPLAGRRNVQAANGYVETARYIGFGLGPVPGAFLFSVGWTQAGDAR